MLTADDTIVAIATPMGKGAISMLRISGTKALAVARELFHSQSTDQEIRPFFPHVGKFYDRNRRILDQVVLLYYQKPKTYTGEDLVEICCHGSPVVAMEILSEIQNQGARLAEPGEFSLRAFLNGKMDLTQAESIHQLIEAQTRRQAQIAVAQIDGRLADQIGRIREALLKIMVEMETAVEFEEHAVEKDAMYETGVRLIEKELNRLVQCFAKGNILRTGKKMAIIGRPNVGKSSLFNQIVRQERAIVYHLPGTTRDIIHETVEMKGVPVTIMDTAGWRAARNAVEREGVERSARAIEEADIVLLVIDMEKGACRTEAMLRNRVLALKKDMVVVWNKIDRCPRDVRSKDKSKAKEDTCYLSAKKGTGIENLIATIEKKILPEETGTEDTILVGIRYQDCLERCLLRLRDAEEKISYRYSEEYILADLNDSLKILGEITGETVTEEILGRIFSTFCIGK